MGQGRDGETCTTRARGVSPHLLLIGRLSFPLDTGGDTAVVTGNVVGRKCWVLLFLVRFFMLYLRLSHRLLYIGRICCISDANFSD